MNTPSTSHSAWSTASFGESADTSPMELSALVDHLCSCQGLRGRLFVLSCVAETMNNFLLARFVTTVAAVGLLIGIATLVT